ncbi:hypothetical protein NQ317_017054 [Molorchus minor]|uniref:F5/8 type C domain-containing protein n=1 Tax=Molorchus minor TaxID=1323400 RepID=A0ABQ9K5K8_9CUCU|nr:hypothetical protein NQ317_017054 [Molorchus minor]
MPQGGSLVSEPLGVGSRYEIRSIATQGRKGSSEYVTEYIVEYSDDGEGWKSFHDSEGETEIKYFAMNHILIFLHTFPDLSVLGC